MLTHQLQNQLRTTDVTHELINGVTYEVTTTIVKKPVAVEDIDKQIQIIQNNADTEIADLQLKKQSIASLKK